MMHLEQWIERIVFFVAAVGSSVVFVYLLSNTNATNIDDISGSMGLKAAVGFVALISMIASWGLYEDDIIFIQLRRQLLLQLLIRLDEYTGNEKTISFMFDGNQQVIIRYHECSYYVEVICSTTALRTIYDVTEHSVSIYQKRGLEVPAYLDLDSDTTTRLEEMGGTLAFFDYKKKMKRLTRALDEYSYV